MNRCKQRAATYLVLLLSFAGVFRSNAQSKTDSLIALLPQLSDSARIHTLNTISVQLGFKDIGKSRQYAEQALEISRTTNSLKGEAESLCILCSIMNQQGQFSEALDRCQKAEVIYEKTGNKKGLSDAYQRMGMVYSQQGEYPLALENLFKAIKIRQELNQKVEVSLLIENVGIVYFRQGDYKLALQYFEECYQSYQQQNNLAAASKILVNLGATYNRLKMYPQALEANLQSLTYFEKTNSLTGMSIASNNVGNVYFELKKFDKAISYHEKSLALKQKMNDKRGIAVSMRNLAEAYLGLNNLAKAKEYIDGSLKIAEEIGSKEQIRDAYDLLAKMYERTKDYEAALRYEKKSAQAKDSLFSSEKTQQISKMRAIYETEKAEKETEIAKIQAVLDLNKKDVAITLLNKDNEIKNTQRNFFVVVASSLLILSILVIYLYKQKQKSNDLLSGKNIIIEKSLHERETLLREIHHRVKNNLQIISSLLNLQSKNTSDAFTQGAIAESRNRVKSMSLIHEQLYQEDAMSGVEMKAYMERLAGSLTSSYGLDTERIAIRIEALPLLLDVDTAIPMGLIMNELVSNAMKYAFPDGRQGTILISLKEMAEELKFTISDTGVGMTPASTDGQSFGLSMVNSLMRKLKAEMNITSGQGTTIEVTIRDFRKINTPVTS